MAHGPHTEVRRISQSSHINDFSTLSYGQQSKMKGRQAAILGESIFPWTNRPVSVCWGCALEVQRRRNYRNSATGSQDGTLKTRRNRSRFTTTSTSENGRVAILGRSPTTGSAAAWSGGRVHGTQSGGIPPCPSELSSPRGPNIKTLPQRTAPRIPLVPPGGPRITPLSQTRSPRISSFPSGLGVRYHDTEGGKQVERPSPGHEVSDRRRTLKYGKKVITAREESEEELNTALDYWNGQKNDSSDNQVHGLPKFDALRPTEEIRSGWGLGDVLRHISRSSKVQTALQRHEFGSLHPTNLMPLEAQRGIQTVSPVGEHPTNPLRSGLIVSSV